MQSHKTCTKCGEEKSLDEFYKHKNTRDLRRNSCKECDRKRDRIYREKHLDERRARAKNYYEENRNCINAKRRDRYAADPETELVRNRKWNAENSDYLSQINSQYRRENRHHISLTSREYYRRHRGVLSEKISQNRGMANSVTQSFSSRSGKYSPKEDSFLMAQDGLTEYQKAVHLGRTLSSVRNRKSYIRKMQKNVST